MAHPVTDPSLLDLALVMCHLPAMSLGPADSGVDWAELRVRVTSVTAALPQGDGAPLKDPAIKVIKSTSPGGLEVHAGGGWRLTSLAWPG